MKKICIIATTPITIKTFFLEIADYLHKIGGYDVTFICDYDIDFKNKLPEYIHYHPVKMKRGINLYGILAIFHLIKLFRKNKYSIIQYSTPNSSFYASIASRLNKAPVRLYCQLGIVYTEFQGFKKLFFKLIERVTCQLSTHIEPVSISNLNFAIKEKLFKSNKGNIVWNGSSSGVSLSKFNIDNKDEWSREIRNKYGISENAYIVGYVGRITKSKGIDELLCAINMLFLRYENIYLLLVGELESEKYLEQNNFQWSKENYRIIYSGRTEEVEKFMATFNLFVLPSYREGFGNVIIEAEAMGVPVIVTDIPGPVDAMINGVTGLVIKKRDNLSLYNAIELLYTDKQLSCELGKNGREFVIKHYNQNILLNHILKKRDKIIND